LAAPVAATVSPAHKSIISAAAAAAATVHAQYASQSQPAHTCYGKPNVQNRTTKFSQHSLAHYDAMIVFENWRKQPVLYSTLKKIRAHELK